MRKKGELTQNQETVPVATQSGSTSDSKPNLDGYMKPSKVAWQGSSNYSDFDRIVVNRGCR